MTSTSSSIQLLGNLNTLLPLASTQSLTPLTPVAGSAMNQLPLTPNSFAQIWMSHQNPSEAQLSSMANTAIDASSQEGTLLPPGKILQQIDTMLESIDSPNDDLLASVLELLRASLQQNTNSQYLADLMTEEGDLALPDLASLQQAFSAFQAKLQADDIDSASLDKALNSVDNSLLQVFLSSLQQALQANTPETGEPLVSDRSLDLLLTHLEKLDPAATTSLSNAANAQTEALTQSEAVIRQLWLELNAAREARRNTASTASASAATNSALTSSAATSNVATSNVATNIAETTPPTLSQVQTNTSNASGSTSPVSTAASSADTAASATNGVTSTTVPPSTASQTTDSLAGLNSSVTVTDQLSVNNAQNATSAATASGQASVSQASIQLTAPVIQAKTESTNEPLRDAKNIQLSGLLTEQAGANSNTQSGRDNQADRNPNSAFNLNTLQTTNTVRTDIAASTGLLTAESEQRALGNVRLDNPGQNPTQAIDPTLKAASPVNQASQAPLPQAQNSQDALMQKMLNPQWGKALGDRAIMMAQQGPRAAEIRLDPPELGMLKIRVHVAPGDQVTITFAAPNAAVKEAIEANMPRLRELFQDQGMQLADAAVSDESAKERSDQDTREGRQSFAQNGLESLDTDTQLPSGGRKIGVIDYYA